MIRSKKFQNLSDKQILSRYLDDPQGEALYFLDVEIEQRGLKDQLAISVATKRKKSRHSVIYYLFYLFLFALFVSRLSPSH